MQMQAELIGLSAALAAIDAHLAQIEQGAAEAVKEVGDLATKDAQDGCPVSATSTAGHVHMRETIHAEADGLYSVSIGTDKEYGPYVEHGTSRMRAQPFMFPAFEKNRGVLQSKCGQVVK
jgi:HK97 gp10 family phage protein